MGRLLYDSGKHISQHDFARLSNSATAAGKGSFSYAWLLDSNDEERERGVTVDVAKAFFSTSECDFVILDAPGHRDFVPRMIAGASQADFAVLVIDASAGEFEKGLEGGGQTKEHALLVRGLGVQKVIVAINKMDLLDWREDRFREIEVQMTAFLSKLGFSPDDVLCIPCAGLTGENVVERVPKAEPAPTVSSKKSNKKDVAIPTVKQDRFKWFTGPTLVGGLTRFAPTHDLDAALNKIKAPFRMTIFDVTTLEEPGLSTGLSVSGRIDAGAIQLGDVLVVLSAGESCVVKTIEVEGPASSEKSGSNDYAVAGQMVALTLAGIDPQHLHRGDALVREGSTNVTRPSRSLTAKILAFEVLLPGLVDVHSGPTHSTAQVQLMNLLEVKTGQALQKKKPRVVKPGSAARVTLKFSGFDAGDHPTAVGASANPAEETTVPSASTLSVDVGQRIVLREAGATIATGIVESILS